MELEEDDSRKTIFVMIPSYRDSEAQHTIACLFDTASHPERVSVGVCHQVEPGDDVFGPPRHAVRQIVLPASAATGPCRARRECQTLYAGEDFVLSLDSHMRLVSGWDTLLLAQWRLCRSRGALRPILTCYPPPYELPAVRDPASYSWRDAVLSSETRPPFLVFGGFGPEGMMRFKGRLLAQPSREPIACSFWVSGFAFSSGSVVKDVPYEDLPHLFFGEETLMSARLWTHGYDFFCLGQNVCFHLWERNHRPTFFKLKNAEAQAASLTRVEAILTGEIVDPVYGLGTARPIEEYWKLCGVKWKEKTFVQPSTSLKEDEFYKDPIEQVMALLQARSK